MIVSRPAFTAAIKSGSPLVLMALPRFNAILDSPDILETSPSVFCGGFFWNPPEDLRSPKCETNGSF